MKLRPRQIIGLIAIFVFGGIFVWTLARPEPEPLAVAGAASVEAPSPAPVARSVVPTAPPIVAEAAPPADPMTVGSQEARDDLYCSGVIYAVHRSEPETFTAESQARLQSIVALAEAGVAKLIAEGVATSSTTGAIANAHGEQAIKDHAAGALRLSPEACAARLAPVAQPADDATPAPGQ